VTFRLELLPRIATADAPIRPVSSADVPELVELFQLCFRDNVEYAGWPKKAFHKAARDCVGSLFDTPERARSDASFVVNETGQLSGAALVKLSGQSLLLGPIYVHPDLQRRGHATLLLAAVVNRLCVAGETTLYSLCHLGNSASMAWHVNNDFEEVPDLFVAQHRWRHFFEESRRLECLGDLSAAEAARSEELKWRAEVDRLEALRETDFDAAYACRQL
jgi:N-acetylglutamate synthase-like GNAT family acetyltransferase